MSKHTPRHIQNINNAIARIEEKLSNHMHKEGINHDSDRCNICDSLNGQIDTLSESLDYEREKLPTDGEYDWLNLLAKFVSGGIFNYRGYVYRFVNGFVSRVGTSE